MTYSSTRIMETLKEATAEQHRDAERRQLQKEMVRGELAPETYAAWLGQMLLVHEALRETIAARTMWLRFPQLSGPSWRSR